MSPAVRRLVLDTNVYISAYGFGGKPASLMRAVIAGDFDLVTSPAILAEVAEKLYDVLGFDDAHVREAIGQLCRIAEIVRPEPSIHVISDEPDNRVLECAVAGGADAIVSGDRHLMELGTFEGIRILKVAEVQTDREAEARRLRATAAAKRMKRIGADIGIGSSDTASLVAEARAAESSRHDR